MLINSTEVTPDIRIKLVNGKLKTAVSKFATRFAFALYKTW
jgi:uncharacterized protein YlzI (FlbEa/FlbD family)